MSIALYARKKGMTTVFDSKGVAHAVTVLHCDNVQNIIAHRDYDGHKSVQISAGNPEKKPNKPMSGHFAKANCAPTRKLYECKVDSFDGYDVGAELKIDTASNWSHVDVVGFSKGKGFAGVMKAHNFAGQRASHGVSLAHRKPGSSGQCQDPGRVFPGKKMARRLGNERKTIQSLKIIQVDVENKLILVKGAVPGATGSYVWIKQAQKKGEGK